MISFHTHSSLIRPLDCFSSSIFSLLDNCNHQFSVVLGLQTILCHVYKSTTLVYDYRLESCSQSKCRFLLDAIVGRFLGEGLPDRIMDRTEGSTGCDAKRIKGDYPGRK